MRDDHDVPKPEADGKRYYGGNSASGRKHAGDPKRCAVEVCNYDTRWPRYNQCSRKNGHGPDGIFCKQHSPAEKQKRAEASTAKFKAEEFKLRFGWRGPTLIAALREIAAGHNDPRKRATDVLKATLGENWNG